MPAFVLALASLPVFLIVLSYILQLFHDSRRRLLPGPRPLPLIGNLHQLDRLPHRSLARLAARHRAPLMSLRLGAVLTVVASSPDAAREVLQRHNADIAARSIGDSMRAGGHCDNCVLCLPPRRRWRALRRLGAAELFSPPRMRATEHLRREAVSALLRRVSGHAARGAAVDVGAAAHAAALGLLARTMFSGDLDAATAREVSGIVDEASVLAAGPNVADFFPALAAADVQGVRRRMARLVKRMYAIIDDQIEGRARDRAAGEPRKNDLLDVMLDKEGEVEEEGADDVSHNTIRAVTGAARLQRNKSIAFWETAANLDVLNKTMEALWWTYQQLNADIRRCFAYCSTFPRGYMFRQYELVCMWIAHGLVKTSNISEELEDVGEKYLQELLTFSFMQVQKISGSDYFTIHDMLHELAERVAGSDFRRIDLNSSPKDIPPEVCHVLVETSDLAGTAENCLGLGNLRTLIIMEHCTDMDGMQPMERNHDLEKAFEHLFRRLRKLRVLIVKFSRITTVLSVPASIDQMKHLRYLGFRYPWLLDCMRQLVLPRTFSKLYHMQAIRIHQHTCEVTCPKDMANLINLRGIPAWMSFPNVSRMTSLKMLPSFIVKEEQGYELKQLKDLNKIEGSLTVLGLGIVRSKEEALEAHVDSKEGLRKLDLYFDCNTCNPDVQAEAIFRGTYWLRFWSILQREEKTK